MAEIFSGAVDKGLEGVVACKTGISSIVDVTLCYRGYVIEDLAAHSTFEETIYLLWNDKLPNAREYEDHKRSLYSYYQFDPSYLDLLKKIPTRNVHPMAWLRTAVSLLAHWDSAAQDMSPQANKEKALRLTAQMGSLVTFFVRIREGKDLVLPKAGQSLAWNFLYTLKGETPAPEFVKIFDTCLVLHADHELNCSTFAARVTASSLSDIYSSVVSALGALKGPLHGGANEQVMAMLRDKVKEASLAPQWIKNALANKEKIMGFGHRVYKNGDPRAKILRQMSQDLGKITGQTKWFEMSDVIDQTVQNEKGLLPNVDFYSASVYFCMGIPIDIYTPIFATSRIAGWLAHIFEQYGNNRIYRPRGEWTGKQGLNWQPLNAR